jgi:gliding motility-associated-like protein
LPGFELDVQPADIGKNVYYKNWASATINLLGDAGKTIRLELTTNDCTLGAHFGYAYFDIDENCTTPITGNSYCNGQQSITLQAPPGFSGYTWYNSDLSQQIGQGPTLTISPAPPNLTKYWLSLSPYSGLGCPDTIYTVINKLNPNFTLTTHAVYSCPGVPADLTAPAVTAGSDSGLTMSYYTDSLAVNHLNQPNNITTPGVYYIQGMNASGCTNVAPVSVFINAPVFVFKTNTTYGCAGTGADLTAATVTAGSDARLTMTYYTDSLATSPLSQPNAVAHSGIYYIRGMDPAGCTKVAPVLVIINPVPVIAVTNTSVDFPATVDLSKTYTPVSGVSYNYYSDAQAIVPLSNYIIMRYGGTYYIKATNGFGCSTIAPVNVTINPPPPYTITGPNTFTPNNDGINDHFSLNMTSLAGTVTFESLRIYNRYGQLVFTGKSQNDYWDGNFNGKNLPIERC